MIKVPLLRHQRYISPLQLTSPLRNQQQNVPGKNVDFDPLKDMLWSILLNKTFRISYSH